MFSYLGIFAAGMVYGVLLLLLTISSIKETKIGLVCIVILGILNGISALLLYGANGPSNPTPIWFCIFGASLFLSAPSILIYLNTIFTENSN